MPDLTVQASVRALEQEIGLEPGFLEGLFNEPNDWSFVVKVHAFAEAALTHAITEVLGRPELREPIGYLNMGDTRAGKLTIAQKLGILDDPSVAFLKLLGTMRNRFVHGIKHVNLRIEEYAQHSVKDITGFWRVVARAFSSADEWNVPGFNAPVNVIAFTRNNPKLMVLMAAMNTVAHLHLSKSSETERREHDRRMADAFRALARVSAAAGSNTPKFQ